MSLPGLEGVMVPAVLTPHVLSVERSSQAGVDNSGMPVEAWVVVYADLACGVDLHTASEAREWEQAGMDLRGFVYFPTLAAGGVPDIREGDRFPWGNWPGGQRRYLKVVSYVDELEAGIVGVATVLARKPG